MRAEASSQTMPKRQGEKEREKEWHVAQFISLKKRKTFDKCPSRLILCSRCELVEYFHHLKVSWSTNEKQKEIVERNFADENKEKVLIGH